MNIELLALSLCGAYNTKAREMLLRLAGSPRAVLSLGETELKHIFQQHSKVSYPGRDALMQQADKVLKTCRDRDISVITLGDDEYPERLANIYNPPLALYCRGRLPVQNFRSQRLNVAVVGTRHADRFAADFTEKFSAELSDKGFHIVSGLASGIDTCAHIGSYQSGHTTAVLGSGVDHITPLGNRRLADAILDQGGAIISEYIPGTRPTRFTFPQRNRIISGLSDFILMVQAAKRSGALITVRYGLEHDREILVFRGVPEHQAYRGNAELVSQGAQVISCADDFFRLLDLDNDKKMDSLPAGLSTFDRQLLGRLKDHPMSISEMCAHLTVGAEKVFSAVMKLVLKGVLKEYPGQKYYTNI